MADTSGLEVKIEAGESNTIIQSYLETFNKDMDLGDSITTVIAVEGDEELAIEEGGTYFVDQQGRYYYQASADSDPVMTTITNTGNQDDEVTLVEESDQLMMNSSQGFQSVTLVPSESGNGEVSYVLFVQQPDEEKGEEKKVEVIAENNMAVFDFDENEELERSAEENSDAEDDKGKVIKLSKKSQRLSQRHMCSYCNYTSPRRYLLSRHMKSHSEDRPHKCNVCERGFKTLASLQNHVNTHTGIKPHQCKFCKSAFTTSGELVRHVRYRHTHEKPHKCHECDYASVELSKLKRHVRCHTGERPYQCPHCTYASPDTFKLKRHLRTHTGEKPYVCEYCNMCFTQSNSLKAHKLIHNISAKPVYPCELCPTTCGRKTDLRIHVQKLHTSDKPLKCRRCGKSFPDRYSYKLHNKTHDGEKCFKCEVCPYASTSQRHLNSHMLKHTDEKPYACDQCDQSFRQKQLLRRHLNLYHNPNYVPTPPKEKTHECRECGRQFAHKGNLIRHLAVHDPDSGVHERALALKLGRQKKIRYANVTRTVAAPAQNFMGETTSEEEEDIEEGELLTSEMNSGSVVAVGEDGQQYMVLEVIQLQGEGGEQVAVVSPEDYLPYKHYDDIEQEEEEDVSRFRPDTKIQPKNIKLEKDVDSCFGFDDEEIEEEEDEMLQSDYEDNKLDTLRLLSE